MALNEDFKFTTLFRAGEDGEIVDKTIYHAKRTLEGWSVGIWTNGKYEYCVEVPFNTVIALLNEGEWIMEHEKE